MRVLGVDPGLTRCGLSVIDRGPRGDLSPSAAKPRMVAVGVVRTTSDRVTGDRLAYLAGELDSWLERFEPDVIAIERVYMAEHVPTVMTTVMASGLVHLAGARRGLVVHEHTPTEVKAAVTGSGRADKAQVGAMVARILKLQAPPSPADAADAVALAICHLWRGTATNRYAEAAARATANRPPNRPNSRTGSSRTGRA